MTSSHFYKISLSFFLFYFLIFPYFVSAQTKSPFTVGISASDVSATLSPENPTPNQTVNVTLDSFATDLNAASIVWMINGKKVLSGTGEKQLNFTTGKLGQKTTIDIQIDSQNGSVEKIISVTPASVDLMWEANTYTPPFFKGKPQFSMESAVTIIATPHLIRNGVEVGAGNLSYKWSSNGTVLGDRSGYGKSTLTLVGSMIPRPMDINVEVTDPNGDAVASADTELTPQTPFVLFYKNDPLYGVEYEKALSGAYDLTGNEIQVTAVPYYFSAHSAQDANLTYAWQINGIPIADGKNGPNKIFRRVGDTLGSSNISLSVTQGNTLFQTANQSMMIDFQKATNQTSL